MSGVGVMVCDKSSKSNEKRIVTQSFQGIYTDFLPQFRAEESSALCSETAFFRYKRFHLIIWAISLQRKSLLLFLVFFLHIKASIIHLTINCTKFKSLFSSLTFRNYFSLFICYIRGTKQYYLARVLSRV